MKEAYELVDDDPVDRLDYISKTFRLHQILYGGISFFNDLNITHYIDEFSEEDLEFLHESFCESATPIIQMLEYFLDKAVAMADDSPFVV